MAVYDHLVGCVDSFNTLTHPYTLHRYGKILEKFTENVCG